MMALAYKRNGLCWADKGTGSSTRDTNYGQTNTDHGSRSTEEAGRIGSPMKVAGSGPPETIEEEDASCFFPASEQEDLS